jgi:hypothetical protein
VRVNGTPGFGICAIAIDKFQSRELAYDEISACFRTNRLRARLVTVDIKRAQRQGEADG